MRADLDVWAANTQTPTAWSGTEQVSATEQRGTYWSIELNSLIVKHRDAFAPPLSSNMTRLYVPESKSETGAARARPAEQGLETNRHCGRVVGAS